MLACRTQSVNKIFKLFYLNQLKAKAKTAVVVKKRPIAAVAVNKEKSIIKTILKNINCNIGLKLY